MNLQLQWWDRVGLVGTVSILLGALGILVSLYGKLNLPVFLLKGTWALISLYGIRALWKRRQAAHERRPD